MSGDIEKILGLHSMAGKSKYKTFRGLKENMWNKVHS